MNKSQHVSPDGISLPLLFIPFLGGLIAIGPLAIDIYLPAVPTLRDFFAVSIEVINSSIALFIVGFGIGQFFGGPISDQIGRKRVGIIGLLLFCITSALMLLSSNIEQFQVIRLLQALGGGLATSVCMGSIRDSYDSKQAGRKFPLVMMVMMVAPIIAPVIGTLLLLAHWKAIFIFLSLYSLVILLIYIVKIPETNPKPLSALSFCRIFEQYAAIFSHRKDGKLVPLRYVLVMSVSHSTMIIWLTVAAFVYMDYFGVSKNVFPVFFAANVIGMIITNLISLKLMKTKSPYKIMGWGLVIQCSLVLCLLLHVLFGTPTLWTTTPLIVLSIASLGLIDPSCMSIYMSFFPKSGGSASATFSTLIFFVGGVLSLLTAVLHDGTLIPIFSTMFAASALPTLGYFLFLPEVEFRSE